MTPLSDALALPILAYYAAAIAVFCAYGLHRYVLLRRFIRSGGLDAAEAEPPMPEELPVVTVQLPMFNEPHVAERIIEAACAIDYPRSRLEIQVLDDSTDATTGIARRCCERLARSGHDVRYVHRAHREGYKAGALAHGLARARGELIAVFDADFVPPADILQRLVGAFADERVGMVQARWGHLNRTESLLTRVQAASLDAHFVIEQTARSRTGLWFNFNGTAGVWRRRCIEDAGGWAHDTLTEDTDLSYRAQLAGWRFVYRPHVVCPAELPPTVGALMSQQHRWNKGLAQNAIKLLPAILRSDAPWPTKLEAWFHLTSPLPYVALLVLCLLAAPALWISLPSTDVDAGVAVALGVGCLFLGTVAAATFCAAAELAQGRRILPVLLRVPVVMAIGVGVSLVNTRAVLEALTGRASPFVRTPKFNAARSSMADPGLTEQRRLLPPGTAEIALGVAMLGCLATALARPATLVGVPFLVLFAAGFLMTGIPRLREWRRRDAAAAAPKRRARVVTMAD